MTRRKRIRDNNLSNLSSEQVGCNVSSMSASTSIQPSSDSFRRKRRRHEDTVCLQSDFDSPRHTSGAMRDAPNNNADQCDRGIDALTVAQSNIGQAFYQRRRRLRGCV